MKILHIQTGMTPAGNAAFRLHTAMRKVGIDSSVVTLQPTIKRNKVYNLQKKTSLLACIALNSLYQKWVLKKKKVGTYFYSPLPLVTSNDELHKYVADADVIYLHWIAGGFLSSSDIERIAKTKKPVVFFMHDTWTMTGGCHHAFDCKEYYSGCNNCRMFESRCHIAHKQSEIKRKLFQKYDNLIFVSPSKWMAECARNSYILKGKYIHVIPNVVDEHIFKPIDKNIAKSILNLPQDKFIITFGCQAGTGNRFKGFDYLRDAINKTDLQNVQLVVYGSDYNQKTVDELKYPVTFLGPINDEYALSLICNATDLFVSPSLAESFGLTFLENILCNTPVIGFDCTAIPEIVQTDITGYLAKYKDADNLAKGIITIYNQHFKPQWRKNYNSQYIVGLHLNFVNNKISTI